MFSTGTLPATKSRPTAAWVYLPSFDPAAAHDGTLRVTEEQGTRACRTVTQTYEVQAVPPVGFKGTAYLLVKAAHAGDTDTVKGRKDAARVGEVYECHLHANGAHRCTCTAGATEHARSSTAPCLHVLALREMEATMGDDLPHPQDRAGNTGEDATDADPEVDEPWTDAWESERGEDRTQDDEFADVLGRRLVCEMGGC